MKALDPPPPLPKETGQEDFLDQENENRSILMGSTSWDGFWLFFWVINIIFLFINPGLFCGTIVVLVPVLMVNSVVSEEDSSVRKRKILMYIFLILVVIYIGWKIFEANCCGYEAYGTVPY